MTSSFSFKFGVVGIGDVLKRFVDAIRTLFPEAVIVAVADVLDPAEAKQRLAQLGLDDVLYFQVRGDCWLPPEFWDLIEALYIATPNRFHMPYALEALSRGKHVLIEKPIARSLGEAREILRFAACSRAKLYCTLHYLHYGLTLVLIEVARTGQLEELGLGRCTRLEGEILETDRPQGWRFDPQKSGGDILIDTGPHLKGIPRALGADLSVIDARWDLVPSLQEEWPEVKIGGQRRKPATFFEVDFELEGALFAQGATGQIAVGKGIPKEHVAKRLRLEFERGEVLLNYPEQLIICADGREPIPLEEGKPGWPKEIFKLPYRNILRRFLDCVRGKVDPTQNLEIALATLQDVFKAYAICRRTDFYQRVEVPEAVR